jgi:hypothetical protein
MYPYFLHDETGVSVECMAWRDMARDRRDMAWRGIA